MVNWIGVGEETAMTHCSYERVRKIRQNIRKGVLQTKFKMGIFHHIH
jgi:hypothetical protein